ncbi:undecaprenyl-phosphate galactosephosphotransferase [Canicola haemoglobinophilus]|uniref:Undecaprenyl-phosphate galactosephosphotransferase n=1 Tax=Canicola haemoglobinophilus TaxID=733 RepID=A0AB38H9T7_9PAST|nr:undecaprenyl-phosphate galactose phosphotransferase WbaP [Canicola haemoglobinophilus]STO54468.1 undecaprenyl-phosphate galactosephosphotransferase [Canicola haemoglobinophilus]STO69002.1 undecaprenyl-phosphate galactosephosphotransferase [Canicola haemoglobinophilus]
MMKENLSKIILLFSDFFSFFISLFISIFLLNYFFGNWKLYLPEEQLEEVVFLHFSLGLFCITWFGLRLRHYTYRKPFWLELKEVIRTLFIFFIIDLSIMAFSKLYVSRYLFLLTWIINLFLFPLIRASLKIYLIKIKWYLKQTVIIGSGKNAIDAYVALNSERYLGLKVEYFIGEDDGLVNRFNIPILRENKFNLKTKFSRKQTQFILALENDQSELQDHWLRKLTLNKFRAVSVIPSVRGLPLYSTDMSFLFSHEMILLRVNNNLAKKSSRILKRAMDIIGSVSIMLFLSPLLLSLYLLIKKDGGNAIYGHTRIGRNGKTFNCLKFRSMVVNSKQVLEELLVNDPEARAEWEKDFKLKNDPRITKIGHFIRKTSLDELPQLWNVLKGEMSLVGPRPIIKEELERYEEDVDYYLMAKPGMTGLWQVSGRSDVDYETRVYFDAWYVKNWSLWNDIAILFKTINVVLHRNGAY